MMFVEFIFLCSYPAICSFRTQLEILYASRNLSLSGRSTSARVLMISNRLAGACRGKIPEGKA
jgi:hypothetical protein